MPVTETLNFENARQLNSLYGSDPHNIKKVEDLLHVKTTSRDGWIKVEGEKEDVKKVTDLFKQLHIASQKGMKIKKQEFNYALNAVAMGKADEIAELYDTKIQVSPKKAPIIPKTFNQKNYVRAIRSTDLVFGVGSAGTGKTYIAMAMAVEALKKEEVSRIVLTRPAVEAGEALGFLPGDLREKIFPYLRPLYDALYEMLEVDDIQKLMDKGVIEIAPLAYMRGRTLKNCFVILDEAQNTTTEQMFMFLTRLGPESKCVVNGDATQVDLPSNRKSGLVEAIQALYGIEGIYVHRFADEDIIRHELVGRIVDAYKMHRGVKQTSMTL